MIFPRNKWNTSNLNFKIHFERLMICSVSSSCSTIFPRNKLNVSNSNSKIQFDWWIISSIHSSCSKILMGRKITNSNSIQTLYKPIFNSKMAQVHKFKSDSSGLRLTFCTSSKPKCHPKNGSGPHYTPLLPVVEYLLSKCQTWATFFVWDIQRLAGTIPP